MIERLKSFLMDSSVQINLVILLVLNHILNPLPAAYRIVALAIVLPCFLLIVLWSKKPRFTQDKTLWMSLGVYFLYSAVQGAVLAEEHRYKPILHLIEMSVFVTGLFAVFRTITRDQLFRFYRIACLAVGASCIASLIFYFSFPPIDGRLTWIAENRYAILGGIFVSFYVYASAWLIKNDSHLSKRDRLLLTLTFLTGLVSIYFAKSRGVLLCMLIVLPIYLYFRYGRKIAVTAATAAVGFLAALAYAVLYHKETLLTWMKTLHLPTDMLTRGDTHRFKIWERAVDLIKEKPVFGYGVMADFPFTYPHPHNATLSFLFYQGVVGFILFALFFFGLLFSLRRDFRKTSLQPLWLMVAITCVAGLTDYAQFFGGISIFWFIFWFPLIALWGGARNPNLNNPA